MQQYRNCIWALGPDGPVITLIWRTACSYVQKGNPHQSQDNSCFPLQLFPESQTFMGYLVLPTIKIDGFWYLLVFLDGTLPLLAPWRTKKMSYRLTLQALIMRKSQSFLSCPLNSTAFNHLKILGQVKLATSWPGSQVARLQLLSWPLSICEKVDRMEC